MKKILALLLAAVLSVGMLAGVGSTAAYAASDTSATTISGSLEPGDAVPDFTVTLADGTVFTLSEALKTHKAVMINIWATWCNPCCMEMPIMQEAYADYADDVALVCLSPFDDNESINDFKAENDLDLPLGYDSVGLGDALVQEGYPTTIMIDRFGNYVYYECGSITSVGGFTRMWDYFIDDEYTESHVLDSEPPVKYTGEYPTDEELTEALSADGSLTFTMPRDDKYVWPFAAAEKDEGVVNSNALTLGSVATLSTQVTAKAGDVFAIDVAADLAAIGLEEEVLHIYVNDEVVKGFAGAYEGTWAYEFPEDGTYDIRFEYEEKSSDNYSLTAAGTVALSNAQVVTGKDAEAVLAAQPVYPTVLSDAACTLELTNDSAKAIEFVFPAGMEEYADYFGSMAFYVVPEDTAEFSMQLGDVYDATMAYVLSGYDMQPVLFSALENDGESYAFETGLSAVEEDGYDVTTIDLIPNADVLADYQEIYIFKNEENVNYFIQDSFGADAGITWQYADGTQPSTTECAMPKESEDFLYNITIVDENGDPVNGCMINICDDKNCAPQNLTDTNTYGFNGINDAPYAYVIHVLKVPAGYSFDTTQEFVLNEAGDSLTITVPHA